jgi:hypothetical protein
MAATVESIPPDMPISTRFFAITIKYCDKGTQNIAYIQIFYYLCGLIGKSLIIKNNPT